MPNSANVAHHSLQGVASMLREKRVAVAVWESMLTTMIEGKKPKVVKLIKIA